MIDFKIHIDDSQIQRFIRTSPARANFASREAMKKTGGHYRKWLYRFILRGGKGWPAVARNMRKIGAEDREPLEGLANMARFRVSRVRKTFVQAKIGFFHVKRRGQSKSSYRHTRETFKAEFGMTPARLAKIHEHGRRQRVTKKMRRKFVKMASNDRGRMLRKSTKVIRTPSRPMIRHLWNEQKRTAPKYFEKAFFDIFFDKSKGKHIRI